MTDTRVTVTMPNLGEDVREATISRWLVTTGDLVSADTPLLEVATDKVDTEILAQHAGTVVETLACEDEVLKVGAALAIIAMTPLSEEPVGLAATPEKPQVALDPEDDRPAGPAAPDPGPHLPVSEDALVEVQRLPRIRQLIAGRMMDSLRTSAQLTTVVEVDVTAIRNLRTVTKDQFHQETGAKLTYLPFFAKATVDALTEHPVLAATVNDSCTEITYYRAIHLGIAVDGPKGLMVPVVRDAQHLSIRDLAVAITRLADQVRNNRIGPDTLSGGTFTITNTGSRGALFDTPILNRPQSGILGTGSVVERVVPQRDADDNLSFAVRSMVYLAITYDHRVVDGADAARFLSTIKHRLEAGFNADDLS